jgi:hypothetical protein
MKAFTAEGTEILCEFTPLEAELLGDLATQVVELLDEGSGLPEDRLLAAVGIGGSSGPSSDPAIARLLPSAYLDDDHASQEFRYLTENSLVSRKVANARLLRESLRAGGAVRLGPHEAQAWLRTLADIRLIIASRLGIEHDGDEGQADTDDDIMMQDVYAWLGMVQGSLVDALDA